MRPFESTISLEEAKKRLASAVRPISRTERVRLEDATGRVASADVTSPIDVPSFSRSAMDGYAVVSTDTISSTRSAPVRLRLLDRIYTGQPSSVTIERGTCAEIATGAPLPNGADAVVIVEETAQSENGVDIFAEAAAGQHVGRQGADIAAGDRVVSAGEFLSPARIGAIAAIGRGDIEVFAKPRVAILSTGNEVVEPGSTLGAGQIYDVNRFTLGAVVTAHGGIAQPHRAAQDTVAALVDSLDACADADLIVFSGGSSVGERDLVVDAVAARGQMVFHGIAVRPGKPTAFASIGAKNSSTPFFGMPGNPTSCLSNAYSLLVPFLRELARLPPHRPRTFSVPLGRRITSAVNRHQFYTVRLRDGLAFPAFKRSGDITSLSQADGYIEIPADQSVVEEGASVTVTLF
jgi:molybdenum cofactor synthesis domain-containing protein